MPCSARRPVIGLIVVLLPVALACGGDAPTNPGGGGGGGGGGTAVLIDPRAPVIPLRSYYDISVHPEGFFWEGRSYLRDTSIAAFEDRSTLYDEDPSHSVRTWGRSLGSTWLVAEAAGGEKDSVLVEVRNNVRYSAEPGLRVPVGVRVVVTVTDENGAPIRFWGRDAPDDHGTNQTQAQNGAYTQSRGVPHHRATTIRRLEGVGDDVVTITGVNPGVDTLWTVQTYGVEGNPNPVGGMLPIVVTDDNIVGRYSLRSLTGTPLKCRDFLDVDIAAATLDILADGSATLVVAGFCGGIVTGETINWIVPGSVKLSEFDNDLAEVGFMLREYHCRPKNPIADAEAPFQSIKISGQTAQAAFSGCIDAEKRIAAISFIHNGPPNVSETVPLLLKE